VNTDTKKSALQLMDGGPSKVNPPNSHPSNPIHKATMAAQDPKPAKKRVPFNLHTDKVGEKETPEEDKTDQHETNKTAIIVGAVAVVGIIILATR